VAGQEYHYPGLCVIARKPPHLHYGVVFVARSHVGSRGAQAVRLGHKPNVSVFTDILPRRYLAGFLCQGAIEEGVANPLDEIPINNASEIHSLQDRKNSLYIRGRKSEFWCIKMKAK